MTKRKAGGGSVPVGAVLALSAVKLPKAAAKAAMAAAARAAAADDDALLVAAIAAAAAERAAIAAAAEAAAKAAEAAAAAAAAAAATDPADEPAAATMARPRLPPALTAEPQLLQMVQTVDPTGSARSMQVACSADADGGGDTAPPGPETARQRELRLREARAKFQLALKAHANKRGGRARPVRAPSVYTGDETAEEVAGRDQLLQEYLADKYAGWLTRHVRASGLVENPATCPQHFALLFRFDTAADPVLSHPRAHLGATLDIALVCTQRVLYWCWSDYVDGIMAAATRTPAPLTQLVLTPFNVAAVLPGGRAPSGLGMRLTDLSQLAKLPTLSDVAYPHGIPCFLPLRKLDWGADLGAALPSAAPSPAAVANSVEVWEEDDDAGPRPGDARDMATAAADPVAAAMTAAVRELRGAFPLSRTVLALFQGAEPATDIHAALDAQVNDMDTDTDSDSDTETDSDTE